jgi:HAD superfamily hydrolase (TIGR01450 family)
VPHAAPAIRAARQAGMRFQFVTNNASKSPEQVAQRLAEADIEARAPEITTAAQACAALIRQEMGTGLRVLVVGGDGVINALQEADLEPVFSAKDAPDAIMQGWHRDVGWPQLAQAAYAIGRGARYFATNLDRTLPTEKGEAPGNGAMVAAVVTATGVEPTAAGKPNPPIFRLAQERAGSAAPLVIGDRLDTDLAGARRAELPSLMVLTGVNSAQDLLHAPPEYRPTFVGADLRALARPQLPVTRDGLTWHCGDASATWEDGALRVAGGVGDGGFDQALRAAAACCWTMADDGTHLTAENTAAIEVLRASEADVGAAR